jgi:hypothetical protein
MKKVLDCGFYCHECELFIKEGKELLEWECWCGTEDWENAKQVIETEGGKWSERNV